MIYFAQAGPDGPIKIGFSVNPVDRLLTLGTSHYEELRLLAAVEGTQQQERALHERFACERLRGEWFYPSSRLTEYIANLSTWKGLRPPKPRRPHAQPHDYPRPLMPIAEIRAWRTSRGYSFNKAAIHLGIAPSVLKKLEAAAACGVTYVSGALERKLWKMQCKKPYLVCSACRKAFDDVHSLDRHWYLKHRGQAGLEAVYFEHIR